MITKETLISEIMDMNDAMTEILFSHGLNCCGCPGAGSETLGEAAKGHGIDFDKLLKALNELETGKEG